ncbi:MAG: sulfatase, partial [Bacteroidota bacterium]
MRIAFASTLVLFLLICSCKEAEKPASEELPNIIWLVAEDQSPQFFPMYGDSTIALPNLESLAGDGVVFTNAYSPVPVCAPARSAIITGMYPTSLGTHNMRTYAPWREMNEPSIGVPNYSPQVPDGVKMFTQYLRKKGYYCTNNSKEDYNFRKLISAWDESGDKAHWQNRPNDAPFFSVFNFNVCHESGIWRNGDKELFVSADAVPVPPYFPDNPVIRHDLAVNYSNLKRMDDQLGEIIQQLKSEGLYEKSIIFFYADHGGPFPRHKRALYETGLKVPMVIKFADNAGKETRDDRFISFIDLAPTVLSLAGIEPPKVMQGRAQFGPFESTEKASYTFHSSDRFDEMRDRLRALRSKRFKYIRNFNTDISNALPVSYREQMPMMQELMALNSSGNLDSVQSLWFRTPKPEEELYDLQNDPYEFNNLAGVAQYQDTLLHLRQVMNSWISETNDMGRYQEQELISRWLPGGNPPKLSEVTLLEKGDSITLSCSKP